MDYYYRLLEYSSGEYTYAYSRKNPGLDGRLSYNRRSGETKLLKLCQLDEELPGAAQRAQDAFYKLVSAGLPTEMHVKTH